MQPALGFTRLKQKELFPELPVPPCQGLPGHLPGSKSRAVGTAARFSWAVPADAKHSPQLARPRSHRSHPNLPARAASSSAQQLLPECPPAPQQTAPLPPTLQGLS